MAVLTVYKTATNSNSVPLPWEPLGAHGNRRQPAALALAKQTKDDTPLGIILFLTRLIGETHER